MGAHAPLAPSGAPIWGHCSFSVPHQAAYPQEETEDTREGEAVHWFGENKIKSNLEVFIAPNGVIITQEMRDAADVYVDNVRETFRKYVAPGMVYGRDYFWGIESPIKCPSIHETDCYGTPDAWLYIVARKLLITWNFKYGHREVVEFEDLQEVVYVSGLIDLLRLIDLEVTVDIRIVQPRCYTARGIVRSWVTPAHELRGLWNMLKHQAELALGPAPVAVTGPWCGDCSGRHACETLRRSGMSAVDYSGKGNPEPLTPDAIGFELTTIEAAISRLESRKTGLQEQAKNEILRGHHSIPGWTLEQSIGRLEWKVQIHPDEILKMGKSAYGIDLRKSAPDLITPTQARKRGVDEFVINAYAERPKQGLKLVKQDETAIRRILSK